MTEQEIKDKLTKICPCKQVTKAQVKAAIAEGADTLEKVKEKTGVTTGCCKGRRCKASIEELIENYQ